MGAFRDDFINDPGTPHMFDSKQERARLSLEGLSVGDAFGQQFFHPGVVETATPHNLPVPPWNCTDDTEMAMAIVQVLEEHEEIDQDTLARTFAERFAADPYRGYGAGARMLLESIRDGADWRTENCKMFGGQGSFGNGGAMRVAPLGGWYADNIDATIEQARRSALVTHTHHEGVVGTIAVALAAGWAARRAASGRNTPPEEMLPWVISHLEPSEVRSRLEWASTYELDTWQFTVASQVGCGEQITAQDTVPFCLWLAASRIDDYPDAMWTAARVGGDIDTNCAIIGGILALSVGWEGIPEDWRRYRERLSW